MILGTSPQQASESIVARTLHVPMYRRPARATIAGKQIVVNRVISFICLLLATAIMLITTSCDGFSSLRYGSNGTGPTSPSALAITTSMLPSGKPQSAYDASLSASGGKQPYFWSVSSGTLPPGLALSSNAITGTPTQSGTFPITVQVNDSSSPAQSASNAFSLVIAAPTSPSALAITTSMLPSGKAQSAYAASLSASGGKQPYFWSVSSGTLPPGLALSSNAITGTPTQSGTFPITVQVNDSSSPAQSASNAFSLVIAAPTSPSALAITTSMLPSGKAQSAYDASLSASGGKQPYFWSVSSGTLPPGLALSSNAITGTPTQSGTFPITVQVNDSSSPAQSASNAFSLVIAASVPSIPASFWGLIINHSLADTLQVPYGEYRGWDAGGAQWPSVEICKAASANPDDPCFDWTTNFDIQMADLFAAGVNDVMYTMSRTPQWGVDLASDPTGLDGTDCNYYQAGSSELANAPGQCLLPVDLNADGSGTDQIWKNWITAIAAHVNNPTYLQSHAHIKYWEPWNEWFRGSIILPNYVTGNGQVPPTGVSYAGTYAQMVRLVEDMRCVITGKGTIHNFPSAGKSTPCSATPIDANALIVSPDGAANTPGPINVTQNFLYCNGTGSATPASGSYCTTGNAGSQAVDIINFHLPAGTITPETVVNTYIPNARARLQAADLNKPMINGEGSWNIPGSPGNLWSDHYAQAGFVPRFFALYWSAGLTMNIWNSYDTDDGELFNSYIGKLNQPAATSWTLTYNTLVGATPIHTPFCSNNGTVYTCDFTKADGAAAELVWDAQYGQNCSQMANPIICGSTNYSVPTQFNQDWVDVTGAVHDSVATVTIGANPILLEGN